MALTKKEYQEKIKGIHGLANISRKNNIPEITDFKLLTLTNNKLLNYALTVCGTDEIAWNCTDSANHQVNMDKLRQFMHTKENLNRDVIEKLYHLKIGETDND
tara:strand:+ start:719 stop:1027 length:309 start_codon:yes stop_codon:yes gene_type:complete